MRRPVLVLLLSTGWLFLAPGPALPEPPPPEPVPHPLESAVDLKNEASLSVSVPLGTDNGISAASDFALLGKDNTVLFHLYPVELYANRFWSQPLSADRFSRVPVGMPVRAVSLSEVEHAMVRAEGEALQREYREKREEARREAARVEIGKLREKRRLLEGRREDLDERLADAERDLADEESRMEWLVGAEDRDIDHSLEEILSLADERDELQERRLALSRETPIPRAEIDRLTAEIRRINDRLESERRSIRNARERKRSARYAFLSRRKEWKQLAADRRRLAAEIDAIDRKIRELAERLR
ncbi:MAG: hypothetical protein Kow00128_09240 [Deltaproteobacteria bacterium]